MYHSSDNYEAFVHPRKPEGVANKSPYIVGTGLAGLSAAIFLVRDAQMPGENIHILEVSPVAGGALDGAYIEGHSYCCRGGRELEAHMERLRFAHHTSDIGGAGAFSDMLFIKRVLRPADTELPGRPRRQGHLQHHGHGHPL